MVKASESAKHAYTYIPPSVQKSMTEHMERNMPGHLKKYQQGQGHIPEHVQNTMAQHLNRNMPGHMKQYVNPYLDQQVVNPRAGNSVSPVASSPSRPAVHPAKARSSTRQDDNLFAPDHPVTQPQEPNSADQLPEADNNPYGFIMNPQKPPRRSFSFGGGNNMVQKIAVIGGGLIALIIIFSVASSFLNGADNAQKDKLISLANVQAEIIRMVDTASENLSDQSLLYKASTVKISVESSQKEVLSALTDRGKKVKDEDIAVQNPANDAALSEGQQNSRYDEAYSQLLDEQLADYRQQLQAVYDSGNPNEQEMAVSANEQLKLLVTQK